MTYFLSDRHKRLSRLGSISAKGSYGTFADGGRCRGISSPLDVYGDIYHGWKAFGFAEGKIGMPFTMVRDDLEQGAKAFRLGA